jgi:glyoxylase-like metal-dependent hydrolase (beta-lactamase superfamily II)
MSKYGIHTITVSLPGNPLKSVNDYLIIGKERNLLIDTAFNSPLCLKELRDSLAGLHVDMEKTDIFLTHLHSDHTGLAPAIASSNSRVYISREDRSRLEAYLEPGCWDSVYRNNLMLGLSQSELDIIKATNPAAIYMPGKCPNYCDAADGDTIDLGGRILRCISTPGHTPGHICLYDEEHGIFFSGDHILFDITPNITIFPYFYNPLSRYLDSLAKIRDLDVSLVLPAHRQYSDGLKTRTDQLIAHHEKRLEEAYSCVAASDGVTAYQAAAAITWDIKVKNWGDFPVTQKWFAVGEAAAHLEYLLAEGRVKKEIKNGMYIYHVA